MGSEVPKIKASVETMAYYNMILTEVFQLAEGPTDKVVIGAAIRNLLGDIPFILRQLQPEESIAFLGPTHGAGWGCTVGAGRHSPDQMEQSRRTYSFLHTGCLFCISTRMWLQKDMRMLESRMR